MKVPFTHSGEFFVQSEERNKTAPLFDSWITPSLLNFLNHVSKYESYHPLICYFSIWLFSFWTKTDEFYKMNYYWWDFSFLFMKWCLSIRWLKKMEKIAIIPECFRDNFDVFPFRNYLRSLKQHNPNRMYKSIPLLLGSLLLLLGSCQSRQEKTELQANETDQDSKKVTISDVERGIRANIETRTQEGSGFFNLHLMSLSKMKSISF